MTLTFRDPAKTRLLVALCRRKKVNGTVRRENGKEIVTINDKQFRTATERAKFVAAWATESLETVDAKPQPRPPHQSRSMVALDTG